MPRGLTHSEAGPRAGQDGSPPGGDWPLPGGEFLSPAPASCASRNPGIVPPPLRPPWIPEPLSTGYPRWGMLGDLFFGSSVRTVLPSHLLYWSLPVDPLRPFFLDPGRLLGPYPSAVRHPPPPPPRLLLELISLLFLTFSIISSCPDPVTSEIFQWIVYWK